MRKTILIYFILFNISSFVYSRIPINEDGDIIVVENNEVEESLEVNNNQKSGFDRSRLSLGGIFGLQFGSGHTLISIFPQVGYDISKYVTLGTGLGYTYHRQKFFNGVNENDFRSSYLSFMIFGHFFPIENIIINVQPEISRMWRSIRVNGQNIGANESRFVPILVLGAGLRYDRAIAMIQYDVVQNRYTPYGNTIFYTIGYSFNF